jgi:CBS domain-containing protein
MITVRSILREKGNEVHTVKPETTLRDILRLMKEKDIGAVLVLDDNKQIAGIFSERDYARLNAEESMDDHIPVKNVMTTKIYGVSPKETANVCMALMTDRRIRHLPVLEDDTLVGLISIGDVVKQVIRDQTITIDNLENYIMGRGYNL